MLRLVNNLSILKISSETINSSFTNFQTVRWRKPRWVPIAKSKRFRVNQRPVIPEDEALELRRLYNNYKNHIKSLRRYLTKKYCVTFQASLDPEEILKSFKDDFTRCNAINEQWNAEQKVLREKRLAEQLEQDLDFARKRIESELIKEEKQLEVVEEIVRQEKVASENFITSKNIDAAIEKALAESVDYNFAIDLNGEKIVGRETKPVQEKEKVSVKQ